MSSSRLCLSCAVWLFNPTLSSVYKLMWGTPLLHQFIQHFLFCTEVGCCHGMAGPIQFEGLAIFAQLPPPPPLFSKQIRSLFLSIYIRIYLWLEVIYSAGGAVDWTHSLTQALSDCTSLASCESTCHCVCSRSRCLPSGAMCTLVLAFVVFSVLLVRLSAIVCWLLSFCVWWLTTLIWCCLC